tara:strand:+ start:452 stop:706 length:255 start_codon:yes stop_codon:yes gene_type:complete
MTTKEEKRAIKIIPIVDGRHRYFSFKYPKKAARRTNKELIWKIVRSSNLLNSYLKERIKNPPETTKNAPITILKVIFSRCFKNR